MGCGGEWMNYIKKKLAPLAAKFVPFIRDLYSSFRRHIVKYDYWLVLLHNHFFPGEANSFQKKLIPSNTLSASD